ARDAPLAQEQVGPLELAGPDSAVRPGLRQAVALGGEKWQRRLTVAVVEALDGVGPAVPARIVVPAPRSRVVGHVAVRVITEDIPRMMSDDVENDVDALLVGGLDEVAELFPRAEVGVHVEEILDAIAVVARLEGDLAEWRANPQGGDAKTPQVAELA